MDQLVSGPMTGEEVNAATLAFKKALIVTCPLQPHQADVEEVRQPRERRT